MSTPTTLIKMGMSLSADAEKRHNLFLQHMDHIQHLVWKATHVQSMTNRDFVALCIKVDTVWREIADSLAPNENWQEYRERGEEPVACGICVFTITEHLAKRFPKIAQILLETPIEGFVKTIVLDDTGCTVYDIQPVKATDA